MCTRIWRKLTGDAAERTPQEEDVGSEASRVGTVGNEVRGDDTDDAVPEPLFQVSIHCLG